MSQRSYHLTPCSRLQFGWYNKTQTSDNLLPFRTEIAWVMATFCIAADRSKFHSIPVSPLECKCGPRDSIGPRKIYTIWEVSKIVYSILVIPREKSGARLYLPGMPIYRTPVHFKTKRLIFLAKPFYVYYVWFHSNPANLQTVLLRFLTVVLCYFFHNVTFVKLFLVFLFPEFS
jgi:hypothetical protein